MKNTKFIAFRADKETQFKIGVLQYEDALKNGEVDLLDVMNYVAKKVGYKLK